MSNSERKNPLNIQLIKPEMKNGDREWELVGVGDEALLL